MTIRASVLSGELTPSVSTLPILQAIHGVESSPASDNMLVNSQTLTGIDTITLKIPALVTCPMVDGFLTECMADTIVKAWDSSRFGASVHHCSYANGVHLESHYRGESLFARYVTLGGRAIEGMGTVRFLAAVERAVSQLSAECTRIDVSTDLLKDDSIDLNHIRAMVQSGMVVGYKNVREYTTLKGSKQGTTFYFGSVKAEKMVRIYDKGAEKGTPYKWTRIEVQCRSRIARMVLGQYISTEPRERGAYLASIVAGSVDFKHRVDKNLDRCPRDAVWESIVNKISASPLKLASPVRPPLRILDSIAWIFRTVSRTYSRVHAALGESSFQELMTVVLSVGTRSLDSLDEYLISCYRQAVLE
jgi:hypothetical protein